MNGWQQYYNNDDVESIRPSHMCLVAHNKDKFITLGAGARNTDTEDDNATPVNTRIPTDLRLQSANDNRCVWLYICLLINLTDRYESMRLEKLSDAMDEISSYEHLHMRKTKLAVGKRYVDNY